MATILIVDDNPASLLVLQEILTRHAYRTVTARNGVQALQLAQVDPPDLIITDIYMPEMDGFALCRAWQQVDQLRSIPFIFYTATYTQAEDQELGLALGARHYITKPTEPADLLALIAEVLGAAPVAHSADWPFLDDVSFLQAHNTALIRKLENKVAQLEVLNQTLAQEVSERRAAEEAQQALAGRYQAIVETAGNIILVLAPDFRILEFNREAERIHGAARDMVLGRNYLETFVPPDFHAPIRTDAANVLAGRSTRHFETPVQARDGQMYMVSWNVERLLDPHQHVIGMIAVGQDITEQKRAEEAIKALTNRYELMFKKHVAIMLLIDPDTTQIVDANDAACAYYGYSYDELTAMPISRLNILSEDEIKVSIQHVIAEVRSYYEFKHRLASGEIRDIEVRSGPVEIDGKTLLYSVVHDITDRKLAEAALQASEEQHRQIFETVTDALIIADLDATIVEVNPAACRLYGYTRAEMIGLHAARIIHPDYHATLRAFMEHVRQGKTFTGETVDLRKDGTPFQTDVRGTLLDFHSKPHLLAVVRDVTQHKQNEQRRVELEMEKARANILQHFISSASHDLGTPLTTIKTNMYLLNHQPDPAKQQHYKQVMEQQITYLERLLEDMLSMSRLDQVIDFKFERCDLNTLVRQVMTRFRAQIERKQQQLTFTPASALPPVQIDRIQLSRALNCLLTNAHDYTAEQGAITVRTYGHATHAVIEVADTGCGISPADLPHIFERFYRADKARSTLTGGAGLGLSIAKRIVEGHNGTITVQSEVGQGSVFCLRLPVAGPVPAGR